MKVVHYSDTESQSFNGDIVKNVTGRVVIGKDDGAPNFCMRVFTIGADGFTPKHSHEWEHEIFVHSGKGQLFSNGQWLDVEAGSVIFIPGGEEHQLKNAANEDFTFICLIPSGAAEL
jgi:quercetin dioxygenase-like cupin family protein